MNNIIFRRLHTSITCNVLYNFNVPHIFILLGKLSKMSGLDSATKSTIDGPSKEDQEEIDERYRVAEYYCMLSTAIAGGVESPLQFIFQVVDKTI